MKVLMLIVLLILFGIAGYFLFVNKQATAPSSTGSAIPSPTQPVTSQAPVDTNDLRAGGSSYRDPQGMYVFLYPSDYTQDEQNNGKMIRVYKLGPSQKGQTEMYDGVNVMFESVDLQQQTLEQWVDTSIQTATADGLSEIVEPKKKITQNSYPGFTYTLQGLGEAKFYVLQKDASSNYAVVVTTSVMDPQNVGFQQQVDKILATLEILK
jgi:hypothetical protein